MNATDKLLKTRLIRFGISADVADRIVTTKRIRDLRISHFNLTGLVLAEHIARVITNWQRCYTVDTTRLAMAAR